jgi:hypothetical protein
LFKFQLSQRETITASKAIYDHRMIDDEDPDFDRDDDVLMKYLEEEGLALVPLDFMRELMGLMEEHIMRVTGIDKDELDEIVSRLEDLLGEDGMMDLSIDGIIGWVETLKDV